MSTDQTMRWATGPIEPANTGPRGGRRERLEPFLSSLREHPGRWAVLATYEAARAPSARSRGSQITSRHPGTEYAVVIEDDSAILYLRVPEMAS